MDPKDTEEWSFYQSRYWKELTQFRAHIEYLNLHGTRSDRVDNGISIFLAVTSNGSIAAWAVWNRAPFVWGFLIALSQLINAVRQYLPYQKQKKAIEGLVPSLEGLFVRAESEWFQVAQGDLDDSKINELLTKLKQQKLELTQKHLMGINLIDDDALKQKAKRTTQMYFQATFGT